MQFHTITEIHASISRETCVKGHWVLSKTFISAVISFGLENIYLSSLTLEVHDIKVIMRLNQSNILMSVNTKNRSEALADFTV